MPAAYIHEQIAKKAISNFMPLPSFMINNIDVYEVGAQGPDVLFFYNLLNIFQRNRFPNHLGERIHQLRTGKFLKSALIYAKKHNGASSAWLLGFVAHYATDCTIHPYVYATTNNKDGSENITKHLLLETQFDTWYYRKKGNKRIPRQATCVKKLSKQQRIAIADILYNTCNKVFPEYRLTQKQAYQTIGDMYKITTLLYSPYKLKYYFYSLIEKLIGKPKVINRHALAQTLPDYDYLNLKNTTWTNPWDKEIQSNKSFPELFDIAVELSQEYIATVIKYLDDNISLDDAMKILGGRNFSSGL